ncbi:MAG: SpoIIE family protein phosphatase, partial [Clostridiales bacterium]|nr:SpoIIE family protein phosphatase [Clostridiales bacterium]
DCGEVLLLEEGKQLLMISDGMGVGQKAAMQSWTALSLVSRFLEAGFSRDTAIDTVNAALALRGREESFVTLDLCLLDLYTGEAEFIKTGGAPSFIKRGNSVKMIKASSLPVGMLTKVEKEVISDRIFPGDMIIMASDGLLDAENQNDAEWLCKFLEQINASTPQEVAEFLLAKVISMTGGRLKDDITVLVAQMAA